MLRMFYVETQNAQGQTQAEAERAGSSVQPIAGFEVLSERSVAEPRETIAAVGATLEETKAELQRIVPAGAGIISEKILAEPHRHSFVIRARDEEAVKAQARERFGSSGRMSVRRTPGGEPTEITLVDVESVITRDTGRRGFLGLGRRLPTYDIVVQCKACVERTYFPGWRLIRTLGVPIHSIEALQRCASSDNLTPDADFEDATRHLKAEGRMGSLGLAKLIDTCRESYSGAILWTVLAASTAEPTQPLVGALEALLKTPQKARPGDRKTWFTPELIEEIGLVGYNIGWSDRTYGRLQSLAGDSLNALEQKMPAEGDPPLPGSIVITCERCNEPAFGTLSGEALCETHYRYVGFGVVA